MFGCVAFNINEINKRIQRNEGCSRQQGSMILVVLFQCFFNTRLIIQKEG